MLPELGQFAIVLALLLALAQAVLPLIGAHHRNARLMAIARPAAYGQLIFVGLAFALLTHAFVVQDFSVAYVARNSNTLLPMHYRYSAVWGAHEGSLLLWALILSLWSAAVARFSHSLPAPFAARVIAVMGVIAVGFLSFLLFTSSPFLRHVPALTEGNDLNPLLQDPGLIIHPPMLYMGYVGFSVAFAFAVAALIEGKLDTRWVNWSRPWTKVAWSFLTLGIALGSWWAYYELGWGGWWFWDPVENASFMPWLVGTALIHSQAVTDKRGGFRAWTSLLAIVAFSLSLLGTFLVRSGVLTSVHAFASDPARGSFILVFLLLVTGGALVLHAWRAPRLAGGEQPFATVSRETLLLVNNLLLAGAAGMVLLGTLFPLVAEAAGWGKVSVGPPYFGTMFILFMAPLVLLVPFGPLSRWQRDNGSDLLRWLRPALLGALVVGVAVYLISGGVPLRALVGAVGCAWVAFGTFTYVWRMARDPQRRRVLRHGEFAGMTLAHFGVALTVCGVLVTESLGIERDVRLAPGQTTELGAYTVRFDKMDHLEGPNYRADRGHFTLLRGETEVAQLHPQKRLYASGGQVMTEAAIAPGFANDVYLALGEPLGQDEAWAVRVYLKPFVRWIWLGALFMVVGGFIAAADKRYRRARTADDALPEGAARA
jgi:cytochrome c-type biogenesis protein CcmF